MHFLSLVAFTWIFLLTACSSETNLWRMITPKEKSQGVDALLTKAQADYDAKNFEEALESIQIVSQQDPYNEKAAVLSSQIHLSLAGLDSFQLVKRLMTKPEQEEGTETSGGAGDQLAKFRGVLGLNAANLNSLTLPDNRFEGVEGAPESGPFAELPVLLPEKASVVRTSADPIVSHISQAILALCTWVEDDVKLESDIRHRSAECQGHDHPKSLRSQSHFYWAIAHLSEAILFHAVVLYQPEGDQPNLLQRVETLNQSEVQNNLLEYISALEELATVTELIFPSNAESADDSLLIGIFNDLETASRGFQSLAGIPPTLTAGIFSSIQGLSEQRDQLVQSGSSLQEGRSKAIKNQLIGKLGTSLGEQITTLESAGRLSGQDLADACESYTKISDQELSACQNSGI